MKFEIIFVRHGVSCANQIQNKGASIDKLWHVFYTDPELTRIGIQRSTNLGEQLTTRIKEKWNNHPWTIGASNMIRAQQTAYYMLAQTLQKKIYIMPHIGEKGMGEDNTPITRYQHHLVEKIVEPFSKFVHIPKNFGKIKQINTIDSFKDWVQREGFQYFGKGNDNVYRAVIFTHSHFLKHAFPDIPSFLHKDVIANNEAIFCRWDSEKEYIRGPENPKKNIIDAEHITYKTEEQDLYECPDGCRKWTPCMRTVKNRKVQSRTRKNAK